MIGAFAAEARVGATPAETAFGVALPAVKCSLCNEFDQFGRCTCDAAHKHRGFVSTAQMRMLGLDWTSSPEDKEALNFYTTRDECIDDEIQMQGSVDRGFKRSRTVNGDADATDGGAAPNEFLSLPETAAPPPSLPALVSDLPVDAAIAVNEQAPQTQRLPTLPKDVVNEIKTEAEALIRQGVAGTSAYLTSILISSFYGEGKTLGEFLNKFYNVADMRTLPRGDRRIIAVTYHVNDLKKKISNRSVAPSEPGALGGDAEIGEAADLPEAGVGGVDGDAEFVEAPDMPEAGFGGAGGDAEMVESAVSGDARPLAAAIRAPRPAYVQFTAEHKQFATAWIRENYIRAITEWTEQNRTGTPSNRALMTPNYTEANYIDAMKAHFGDVNVNWSALKEPAVRDLAGELEQQLANPNVKLNKSAKFNTTRAPKDAQDAQVDERVAVPLGDAAEHTPPDGPSSDMLTPIVIQEDAVSAPRITLRQLLSHKIDAKEVGFEILPYDDSGKSSSELVHEIISLICQSPEKELKKPTLIRLVRNAAKLSYFTKDEPVLHLLQILSTLLSTAIQMNPIFEQFRDIQSAEKLETVLGKNGKINDYVENNVNYWMITKSAAKSKSKSTSEALLATGYTLWFKPILDMILERTETPELMFESMKHAMNTKINAILSNMSRKACLQSCEYMTKCISNMNYLKTSAGKTKSTSVQKQIVADVGSILEQLSVLQPEQPKAPKQNSAPVVFLDDDNYMKNTEGANCFFEAMAQIWYQFEAERGERHTSREYKDIKRTADILRTLAARMLYVPSDVEKAINLVDNDAVANIDELKRFIDQTNAKVPTFEIRIVALDEMDYETAGNEFVIREQNGDTYRLLKHPPRPELALQFNDWFNSVVEDVPEIPKDDVEEDSSSDVDDSSSVVCELPKVKANRSNILNKMKHINSIVDNLTSGWADQAAQLTQKIVTRSDFDLLAQNDTIQEIDVESKRELQVARIGAAFNPETCYVESDRRIPTVKEQKGSAVQIMSAKNALESYNTRKRAVLYDWATGTGKTSAIWGEIFAAACQDVGHAYISLTRWGTAQDIYSNVFEAMGGNHILDIARVIHPNSVVGVGGVTMYTLKKKVTPPELNWERESYGYINDRTGRFEPAKIWNDVTKRALSFEVTISNESSNHTITVYLSTLTEWSEIAALEETKGNPRSRTRPIEPKKSKWNWRTRPNDIQKVIDPILSNERRIFIVDEAHELRTNTGMKSFFERRINEDVFEYLDEDTYYAVPPYSWSLRSTRFLSLMRGDLTVDSYRSIDVDQNLLRCVYLTATPIAQNWSHFINFLSSMFLVTSSNQTIKDNFKNLGEYDKYRIEREERIAKAVEPIEDALSSIEKDKKRDALIEQNEKIAALKDSRQAIQHMMDKFGISISLDLFSNIDMPYTNYSMTNTGVGYKGLTLTQNDPIDVYLEEPTTRFALLTNTKEFWGFVFEVSKVDEYLQLYDTPVSSLTIAKVKSKGNGKGLDADDEDPDNDSGDESEDEEEYESEDESEDQTEERVDMEVTGFGARGKPIQTEAPGVPPKPVGQGTRRELLKRFTCAVYCFASKNGGYVPFPAMYKASNSTRSFHDDLFELEYNIYKKSETLYKNLFPERTLHYDNENSLLTDFAIEVETDLLKSIYAVCLPNTRVEPKNQAAYRERWKAILEIDDDTKRIVGLRSDLIRCHTEKLDMIADAVKQNTLSPSMVFMLINGFGGSDHLAMLLEKRGIKFQSATYSATEYLRKSDITRDKLYQERCIIMNGDTLAKDRDAITNEETGIFNDDRNANGEIIRCIIYVKGSAASVTLRNVLVCHYPIDDTYMLEYVQSLGRIARRSGFNPGRNKLKIFGFTAAIPELTEKGHPLVELSSDVEGPDQVASKFVYAPTGANKKPGEILNSNVTHLDRHPGQYTIKKVPIVSYITYKSKLDPNVVAIRALGASTDFSRTPDDRLRELALQKASIYTIIQLALATLSQNCSSNSEHFAQITGNREFRAVCAVEQYSISGAELDYNEFYIQNELSNARNQELIRWLTEQPWTGNPQLKTARAVSMRINRAENFGPDYTNPDSVFVILKELVRQGKFISDSRKATLRFKPKVNREPRAAHNAF
jgi:hypothetical protein